jgi:hypothetical protein
MAGLVRRESLGRKVLPSRTGLQNPEDAAEHRAGVFPRTPFAILADRLFRDQRLDERPLDVGDFHAQNRTQFGGEV